MHPRMHGWAFGRGRYNSRSFGLKASVRIGVYEDTRLGRDDQGGCSYRSRRSYRSYRSHRVEPGAGAVRDLVSRTVVAASADDRASSSEELRDRADAVFDGNTEGYREECEEEVEGEYEEIALPEVCPGCGVALQIEDPDGPGFCRVPERVMRFLETGIVDEGGAGWDADDVDEEEAGALDLEDDDISEDVDMSDFVTVKLDAEDLEGLGLPGIDELDGLDDLAEMGGEGGEGGDDNSSDSGDDFNEMIRALNMEERMTPGGGSSRAEKKTAAREKREPRPRVFRDAVEEEGYSEIDEILSSLVCARCYSLKHYGKIKSTSAEAYLPDFDVAASVGEAIRSRQFRRAILLAVVDLADFDGSLPRLTIQTMVQEYLNKNFTFVIAANKADLLPKQATQARLEQWVRKRVAQGGLPKPASVHIVSSHSGAGIKTLLVDLQKSLGGGGRSGGAVQAGDVWVVGAQNAGKSSLINAMKKAVGVHRDSQEVTAAPMPGTTLGVVPVTGGLVPRGCEMLDTPGVRHEYQITTRLDLEEVRMLLPKRSLKPRTYRLGEGNTIHMGGLARLDVTSVPGSTMYLTVWVSDEVRTHLGKTSNAAQLFDAHVGRDLTPPVAVSEQDLEVRIKQEMPRPIATEVSVNGDSWKQSSVDVCIAGLGWVAIGVRGEARLTVWAPPGVSITTRDAIVPDFAKEFCKPGFDKLLQRSNPVKRTKKKGGAGKR